MMVEQAPNPLLFTIDTGGSRLDSFLATHVPDVSRARVQQLIKNGEVTVNERPVKSSYKLVSGDRITFTIPPPVEPVDLAPENIPLDIRYQDADLLVINKPAGLVVHPAAGNWSGTLVNALRYHVRDLSGIGGELRPGIVHRLDKETSGLMLVAKNDVAHRALASMIEKRDVVREYLALAWGDVKEDAFTVDAPIGRHPADRQRMAVLAGEQVTHTRRNAVTHFTVCERMPLATALHAKLDTGRTHQIRVHLSHVGHPVVGDPIYGGRAPQRYLSRVSPEGRLAIDAVPGQALHAFRLTFPHPRTGQVLSFETAPPEYFLQAWNALRAELQPK